MIGPQDIRDRAAEWQLRPETVEKDYVLGWLLAALGQHPVTGSSWIFKGGTCLKKCYIETYRFSEDLDFSLLPDAPYSAEEIKSILHEVATSAGEMSGIEFPFDPIVVRPRQDKLGRPTFEARVYYRGPLGIPTYPRILFDLTNSEPVLDADTHRPIFHPYPDVLPDNALVTTYSLNEVLAEKTRALYERTRPRDLYDVVYLLDNEPEAFALTRVRELFGQKCGAKELATPSTADLLQVVRQEEELRSEWANMLGHQLPVLPELDSLLLRLPELLAWLDEPEFILPEVRRAVVPTPAGEGLVAPAGIQYWGGGTPLETIRFAGANRLLLEFSYNGSLRRAEPYSLRRAATGNLLLYAWEQGETHIKAFNTARMANVTATTQSFTPRYRIELTPRGPVTAPTASSSRPRSTFSRPRRTRPRTRRLGPHYVFRCPFCGKRFRRSSNNPTLGKHKVKDGNWQCSGRRGYLVSVD